MAKILYENYGWKGVFRTGIPNKNEVIRFQAYEQCYDGLVLTVVNNRVELLTKDSSLSLPFRNRNWWEWKNPLYAYFHELSSEEVIKYIKKYEEFCKSKKARRESVSRYLFGKEYLSLFPRPDLAEIADIINTNSIINC